MFSVLQHFTGRVGGGWKVGDWVEGHADRNAINDIEYGDGKLA